jgi:hypothetical protein
MRAKLKSTWKTWLLRAVIGVVIAGVAIGACLVYQGITISLRAEHALHATLLMVTVVEDYVKANNGAWPRSWKDLETLPPREWAMFTWPDDSTRLQEYVAIEFAIDPAKLARQRPEEFGAIRPIPPCYPYKDYAPVPSLLKTLRDTEREH